MFDKQNANQYQKRLMAAFRHPAHEYVFVRHFEEQSFCECGHGIYHNFLIEHPASGHQLVLGSECINNYSDLEGVRLQVAAHLEKQKEDAKKAKQAQEEAAAVNAGDEYYRLMNDLRALYQAEKQRPFNMRRKLVHLGYIYAVRDPLEGKEWKTSKRWVKAYSEGIEKLQAILANPWDSQGW